MAENNSITITLGFKDSEQTRKIKFDNLPDDAINPSTVKTKIKAVNASLAGGTAGGLSSLFISDDGDAFASIIAGQIDSVETQLLDISD